MDCVGQFFFQPLIGWGVFSFDLNLSSAVFFSNLDSLNALFCQPRVVWRANSFAFGMSSGIFCQLRAVTLLFFQPFARCERSSFEVCRLRAVFGMPSRFWP